MSMALAIATAVVAQLIGLRGAFVEFSSNMATHSGDGVA